ncbi:MAG TPA: FlgD immunoglobulin-like domain containing protein, partial [Chitinophagales bacterium]|nr:FlgD immunoglobulin-like domain containing protein [Chitinophagales bacterium]
NEYPRYDSLRASRIMNLDWMFNTDCNCLGDINTLIVEINPIPPNSTGTSFDQPEQFHFNNIGVLTFRMDKDRVNPLLDVTFDGVHIMDGDIVSARPEILIRLKDENKFLLLNDTSLISVSIIDPNEEEIKLHYDGITMQFFPAGSGSNNTAEVRVNKEFEIDGIYTLQVKAKDRSRNISGTYGIPQDAIDYRISFEVIRQARITNVLNYPNPFTSSTRFVFTLTGIQPPDFFKIQIMTVSGKVVRELTQADLGPIHVGKNITEYAWDGTDEFGDPLANGLYLYRVVATIGGEAIEKWENGDVDKFFKNGFGKMYLAR